MVNCSLYKCSNKVAFYQTWNRLIYIKRKQAKKKQMFWQWRTDVKKTDKMTLKMEMKNKISKSVVEWLYCKHSEHDTRVRISPGSLCPNHSAVLPAFFNFLFRLIITIHLQFKRLKKLVLIISVRICLATAALFCIWPAVFWSLWSQASTWCKTLL